MYGLVQGCLVRYRNFSRFFLENRPRGPGGWVTSRWQTASEDAGQLSDRSTAMTNLLSDVLVQTILKLISTGSSSISAK